MTGKVVPFKPADAPSARRAATVSGAPSARCGLRSPCTRKTSGSEPSARPSTRARSSARSPRCPVAEDVRLTVGSVVRLVASYLGGYARVVAIENVTRLVVDLTGVLVRVHASRTYVERWRAEGVERVELRVDVARAEVALTGAPYPLAPAPAPTARPRRPRRPRAEALPSEPAAAIVAEPAPRVEV